MTLDSLKLKSQTVCIVRYRFWELMSGLLEAASALDHRAGSLALTDTFLTPRRCWPPASITEFLPTVLTEALLSCPLWQRRGEISRVTQGSGSKERAHKSRFLTLPSPPELPPPTSCRLPLSYLEADIVVAALILSKVRAALATPGPGKEAQRKE